MNKDILIEQNLLLLAQPQQSNKNTTNKQTPKITSNSKGKIHQILSQRKKHHSQIQSVKQIDQYRKISSHLDIMQRLKKVNSQKLRKLQKNVSNLDFLQRLSFKQTLRINNRKQKLEETQSIVQFMHKLQKQKQKQQQQKFYQRKRLCSSLRQSLLQNKQISMSTHQYIKQSRVRQFKDKQEELLYNYQKNLQDLLQENRRKAHRTRLSQLKLKEKLKKFQEYKIYMGRLNYQKRMQQQFKRHSENTRYLRSVQSKLKVENKMFRKTEKLKQQTEKIEEFYLTGTQ